MALACCLAQARKSTDASGMATREARPTEEILVKDPWFHSLPELAARVARQREDASKAMSTRAVRVDS
eukprot:4988187-Alexandrium_andersonii.AAC.1